MAYGTCERGWISDDFAAGDHGGGDTLQEHAHLLMPAIEMIHII